MNPVTLAVAKKYAEKVVQNRNEFLRSLLGTPDVRFVWPLQDLGGNTAVDASGNNRTGTFDGPLLAQAGPNYRIPYLVEFDGVDDLIIADSECSVRSLSAVTFSAVIEVVDTTATKTIWFESVAGGNQTRFNIRLNANETLGVICRSGTSSQTAQNIMSTSPLPLGLHLIHVAVDVANDLIKMWVDGSPIATSGTPDFGEDEAFADTAPQEGPRAGFQVTGSPNAFFGKLGYISMYGRVLDDEEVEEHAIVGGFA